MEKYITLNKKVGETPLQCVERFRKSNPTYKDVKMAYAGRLDPMASGTLLILLGEECKNQSQYHALDKEYVFEVLFGVSSDSGDVLGVVEQCDSTPITTDDIRAVLPSLIGTRARPYPHFSSKTVGGKPLHTWTLEGKLGEIEIPTSTSTIHSLRCTDITTLDIDTLYERVLRKIESLPPVTEKSKELGNDFRRPLVRDSWRGLHESRTTKTYQIATFTCIASSGTYMRTLASDIGKKMHACALAYSIHRTKIGVYKKFPLLPFGFWIKTF